ncbi:hypothetical protein K1T71_002763 [Dendrolimus kikuchii]|uniref:Uncharacterized protein n=1 Tax=Dendrolimus kikuchii TaxID=765133 RepID=A0ACC1DEK3_9NEOP|nr:hypothetical protein K1T71_002763 [Dendrolimus kikuchii]
MSAQAKLCAQVPRPEKFGKYVACFRSKISHVFSLCLPRLEPRCPPPQAPTPTRRSTAPHRCSPFYLGGSRLGNTVCHVATLQLEGGSHLAKETRNRHHPKGSFADRHGTWPSVEDPVQHALI